MIVETSDGIVPIEQTTWFFFGPPKIGKSTLASGFPHNMFFVTSKKEVQALKTTYTLVDTWDKVVEATDAMLKKKRRDHRYITIDYVDAVFTSCIEEVCKRLKIKHPSEAGYGKGVDSVDLEFKKWVKKLIASEYGIIFISHLQTKEVITPGGTITKTISTLPDRARKAIIPLVSNIGAIEIESVKKRDPDTGKLVFKSRRVINFEPTPFLEAGRRDGVLPEKLTLFKDPKRSYEQFANYYNKQGSGGSR